MARRALLIDGHSMVYRAYFAHPSDLATKAGLPTGASFGFASMLKKLLAARAPDLAVVVFDPPGPTSRAREAPEYKANRAPMADELVRQLPTIHRLVDAHGLARVEVPGVEADDVIATLARRLVEADFDVIVVSADKDFIPLVSERVKLVDAVKDVTTDPELVRKKWGVRPDQFVDLLALMGDAVDNIPGVPGIGQKGAAALLAEFGSLDEALARVGEIKGRAGKALAEHRDLALLSRRLATLDQDVPLDLDVASLEPRPAGALNELYRELEFYSLLGTDARAEEVRGPPAERLGPDALAALLGAGEPVAVVPLYDDPPVGGALVGFGLAAGPRAAYAAASPEVLAVLGPWAADPGRPKLTHDAKRLALLLAQRGLALRGVRFDTMLASFLVDPTKLIPHELERVSREYLHRAIPDLKAALGRATGRWAEAAPEAQASFAAARAAAVAELTPRLEAELAAIGLDRHLREHDLPLSDVLVKMELAGVAIDTEDLARLGEELRGQLAALEREIWAHAGREFNVGSTKQLGAVLFDELGLPVVKRNKTGYATDAEVLERLSGKHPIVDRVLEHRRLHKLIHTYVDVLAASVAPPSRPGEFSETSGASEENLRHRGLGGPEDLPRVHATFEQTTSATGRLITTGPDLQRTPIRTAEGKRIRRAFVAPPGATLISADWSQIELRILAHFSGDPRLVEAFRTGLDVHTLTAREIFGRTEITREERNVGKTVNFATIYGQGARALGQILSVPKRDAEAYIERYFETYGAVRTWLDRTIAEAHEAGQVLTLLGRRRIIPELRKSSPMDRQAGERIAANTRVQGSAADLCKLAMLAIDAELVARGLRTRMLLQIHDELVFEAPDDEVGAVTELVRRHMEGAYALAVPLVVDVGAGRSWADAH